MSASASAAEQEDKDLKKNGARDGNKEEKQREPEKLVNSKSRP